MQCVKGHSCCSGCSLVENLPPNLNKGKDFVTRWRHIVLQQHLVQVPYISWQQYPGISYAKFHSSVSFQSLPISHDLIDRNHLYFILPSIELPENHGFRLEGSNSHPRCCNHDIERRHVIISLFVFLGLWELSVCHLHQALSHGNS